MDLESFRTLHPQPGDRLTEALARCVEHCADCAQVCLACADACLGEEMVADLRQCIRLDLDCATLCAATTAIAMRQTGYDRRVIDLTLHACAEACRLCAEECVRHRHDHCRICAQACRACESACLEAQRTLVVP